MVKFAKKSTVVALRDQQIRVRVDGRGIWMNHNENLQVIQLAALHKGPGEAEKTLASYY